MVITMDLSSQLSQIKAKIETAVKDALSNEVAEAVREEEVKAIKETVYGAYSPVIYNRRADAGGLASDENIEHSVEGTTLHVRNTTDANPAGTLNNDKVTTGKDLPQLIEGGNGSGGSYDWPIRGRDYMAPRPFTQDTVNKLERNKRHIEALKNGLTRQGLKVR